MVAFVLCGPCDQLHPRRNPAEGHQVKLQAIAIIKRQSSSPSRLLAVIFSCLGIFCRPFCGSFAWFLHGFCRVFVGFCVCFLGFCNGVFGVCLVLVALVGFWVTWVSLVRGRFGFLVGGLVIGEGWLG